MKTVNDCVAKLKRLDAKGRLWPQDMFLEVQRGHVVLSDIETKVGHYTLHLKLEDLCGTKVFGQHNIAGMLV